MKKILISFFILLSIISCKKSNLELKNSNIKKGFQNNSTYFYPENKNFTKYEKNYFFIIPYVEKEKNKKNLRVLFQSISEIPLNFSTLIIKSDKEEIKFQKLKKDKDRGEEFEYIETTDILLEKKYISKFFKIVQSNKIEVLFKGDRTYYFELSDSHIKSMQEIVNNYNKF